MKENMGRLIRYVLIIHRLSGGRKYIPGEELIRDLETQMGMRGYAVGMGLRTLQRDIRDIDEMFGVKIRNRRGFGYYIEERFEEAIDYEELLMNFDLLTSVSSDSDAVNFILPEHHRPKGSDCLPALIRAIKDCLTVRFDYTFYRKGNTVVRKTVQPYFLKESLGLWYLLAVDSDGRLKVFGIDRIGRLELTDETFKKDGNIDPNALFTDSYGIWDDPKLPVEEIELAYSPLDGSFLKAMPLHRSQTVLADNDEEFRIRLRLRITNDFVMALLSRSASLTVIRPVHLRERIRKIYEEAMERNQ